MATRPTGKSGTDLIVQIDVVDGDEYIIWFIAGQCDKVYGYAAVKLIDSTIGYFGPCYIFPAYRGKGLQVKLMEAREEWCKKNKIKCLTTRVDHDNIYSRRNIEAFGFNRLKEINGEIWYTKDIR